MESKGADGRLLRIPESLTVGILDGPVRGRAALEWGAVATKRLPGKLQSWEIRVPIEINTIVERSQQVSGKAWMGGLRQGWGCVLRPSGEKSRCELRLVVDARHSEVRLSIEENSVLKIAGAGAATPKELKVLRP